MRRAPLRAFVAFAAVAAFFVFGGAGAFAHGEDGDGATLIVDDPMAPRCPGAMYFTIQAAVDAANPGDKILVCPGVYDEQVEIRKPLEIEGKDFGNQDAPIVKPTAAVANTTSLVDPDGPGPETPGPIAAIILADHAKSVEIEGLTIDGSSGGITGCAPNYVGMYYRNTSGDFEHNAVREIQLAPALFGCQSGQAIFVQSGNGKSSYVEIEKNTVHEYQKTGILANEPGTKVEVSGNTVSGFGVTPQIAQNGVQIGWGAQGSIHHNSVINHIYGLCRDVDTCGAVSTNILVFGDDGPAQGVSVYENVLGKSQVNVYFENDKGKVEKNLIFDADVFDGIYVPGDYNRIVGNTINDSDEAAVWVDGTKNTIALNVINEATEGIHDEVGGNWIGYNLFYNVVQKRTPAPTSLTTSMLATPTDEAEELTLVGLPSLLDPKASSIRP